MPIETRRLTVSETLKILERREGHFLDIKRKEIKPSKLSRAVSAFSNSDGGELLIGIGENPDGSWVWDGFKDEEDANGIIQAFETWYPLSSDLQYVFLESSDKPGLVLQIQVLKSRDIRNAQDGIAYVRRGLNVCLKFLRSN